MAPKKRATPFEDDPLTPTPLGQPITERTVMSTDIVAQNDNQDAPKLRAKTFVAQLKWLGVKKDELVCLVALGPRKWEGREQVGKKGSPPCWYGKPRETARALSSIEDGSEAAEAQGIYIVANRMAEGLSARELPAWWSVNAEHPKDSEIVQRRMALIDFDPKRIDGTSSTDDQLEAAETKAKVAYTELSALLGGGDSLALARSGNGCHVLIALDIPTDDGDPAEDLIKKLLAAAAAKWGSPKMIVDSSVYDERRLIPAYGTWKRKGANTEKYPHRLTTFEPGASSPTRLDLSALQTLVEMLEGTLSETEKAKLTPTKEKFTSKATGNNGPSDLDICSQVPMSEVLTALSQDPAFPSCPSCGAEGDSSVKVLTGDRGDVLKCMHSTCGSWSGGVVSLVAKSVVGVDSLKGDGGSVKKVIEWFKSQGLVQLPDRRRVVQPPVPTAKALEEAGISFDDDDDDDDDSDAPIYRYEVDDDRELSLIRIHTKEMEVNNQGVAALCAGPIELYQRGGKLLQVGEGIAEVELPTLREILSASADWEKLNLKGDEWVPAHPPDFATRAIHARKTWGLPNLKGLISAPCMMPDGHLLTEQGYDQKSGLYMTASMDLPVPTNPTKSDAMVALDVLRDLIVDFPFKGGRGSVDESAALAAILTPGVRAGLQAPAPFFLIRAATPGTGKDLMASLISIIWTGAELTVQPPVKDQDEVRKNIYSVLRNGAPISVWDDLASWGGPVWASLLTAPVFTDRELGVSKSVAIPVTTTWIGTGNNTRVWGDCPRRTVLCDLLSPYEDPEKRPPESYRHPERAGTLFSYAESNREMFLTACLTILRAYQVAGCPNAPVWGSFEAWSKAVAGPLVWLGLADPTKSYKALAEEGGTDVGDLGALLTAWLKLFGSKPVSSTEILKAVKYSEDVSTEDDESILCAALIQYVGGGGLPNVNSLGMRLRKVVGRVVGGLSLGSEYNKHAKSNKWVVRVLDQVPAVVSEVAGTSAGTAGTLRVPENPSTRTNTTYKNNDLEHSAGTAGTRSPTPTRGKSEDEDHDNHIYSGGGLGSKYPQYPQTPNSEDITDTYPAGTSEDEYPQSTRNVTLVPATTWKPGELAGTTFSDILVSMNESRGWGDARPRKRTRAELHDLGLVPGVYPAHILDIDREAGLSPEGDPAAWVVMSYTSPETRMEETVRCWISVPNADAVELLSPSRQCPLLILDNGRMSPWPYDETPLPA